MPEFRQGLVIKNYSGFYYVQDHQGVIFECKTRGKIKEKDSKRRLCEIYAFRQQAGNTGRNNAANQRIDSA